MRNDSDVNQPKIKIESPKMFGPNKELLDLSDHYPIEYKPNQDIKIVSYNLQYLYTLIADKSGSEAFGKRTTEEICNSAKAIATYFSKTAQADICCVQELFDSKANHAMEKAMEAEGYAATELVGAHGILPELHSGVRIFYKKSANLQDIEIYQKLFKNKIYIDSFVNKGIVHLTFKKNGQTYHVFNTHLQANHYSEPYHFREVTLAQCVEFKRFIEEQREKKIISDNDQVILSGDFNLDKVDENVRKKSGLLGDAAKYYKRLTYLMGPEYQFVDYYKQEDGPKHTLSHLNTNYFSPDKRKNFRATIWKSFVQENPQEFLDISLTDEEQKLIKETTLDSLLESAEIRSKINKITQKDVLTLLDEWITPSIDGGRIIDLVILYNPNIKKDVKNKNNDFILSEHCCELQLALARFVQNQATIISRWSLSKNGLEKFNNFNERFFKLIDEAEKLKFQLNQEREALDKGYILDNWIEKKTKLLNEINQANQKNNFIYSSQLLIAGLILSPFLILGALAVGLIIVGIKIHDRLALRYIDNEFASTNKQNEVQETSLQSTLSKENKRENDNQPKPVISLGKSRSSIGSHSQLFFKPSNEKTKVECSTNCVTFDDHPEGIDISKEPNKIDGIGFVA